MTTTVIDVKNRPAVLLDKVHVDSFLFTQKRTIDSDPLKVIKMGYCLYGRDVDGNRVYDEVHSAVNDNNMEQTVIAAANAAGQTVEDFTLEYETHKAELEVLRVGGGICDAELMAYFELAMARVAELNGSIKIASVD